MGKKRHHLLCHKIPNTCRYSALNQGGSITPHPPKCGHKTFFQKVQYRKWKKSNFTVEKSDKHYSSQMIKVNINSDKYVPSIDGMRMTLYLNDLPPQTPQPQSNHDRNIR